MRDDDEPENTGIYWPSIATQGDTVHLFANGIYVVIILVEVLSILENFKDLGEPKAALAEEIICEVSEMVGFGKIAALLRKRKKGEGDGKE